jgi:CBS domain containing-hemolysin-like protein
VTGAQAAELVVALLLVPLAGMFAAADAAITTMSPARVDQLVREGKTGARALATVVADKPRHLNLVLLLRLSCESVAT